MKLLLDTHTFLWLVEGSPKLSPDAESALGDPANVLYLSSASVWELAIKTANRKLLLSDALDVFVAKWMPTYQLNPLPIDIAHALGLVALPSHHNDPFDRMLIAQAIFESMTLVSGDSKFPQYPVPIIW